MQNDQVRLVLPWPPSLNRYWRRLPNRVLISKEGRRYRKSVLWAVTMAQCPKFGRARLALEIAAYPPDRRTRDLDNTLKGLLDALEHAGVFDDDGQIDWLLTYREKRVIGGRIEVSIQRLEDIQATLALL
jgi:crossover junction endodeoxyribonuclease RusA